MRKGDLYKTEGLTDTYYALVVETCDEDCYYWILWSDGAFNSYSYSEGIDFDGEEKVCEGPEEEP